MPVVEVKYHPVQHGPSLNHTEIFLISSELSYRNAFHRLHYFFQSLIEFRHTVLIDFNGYGMFNFYATPEMKRIRSFKVYFNHILLFPSQKRLLKVSALVAFY